MDVMRNLNMREDHQSKYVSHTVDANGIAQYSSEENQVWHDLVVRQLPIVTPRACKEYLDGIKKLQFTKDHIPQCKEISKILREATGWQLEPVPALIPYDHFFSLIANKKFPAATFIRRRDEIDYLQEPDIFHEIFGHCPLLTNQAYANFTETYGKLGQYASEEDRIMLARLYWFTIEFGLINTKDGLRVYGGGILSSKEETIYSLESPDPIRKPFDVMEVLRTPYRIDIKQPIYYVIDSFDTLFHLADMDLLSLIKEARKMGLHKPLYKEKETT